MEVRITARHVDAPDDVKDYANEKLAPLGRFNSSARSVEVVFGEDGLVKTVEVIAHLTRGAPVVVHARHDDARAAVDLAHDKLERVLRRAKERREARRHSRGGAPAAVGSEDATGDVFEGEASSEEE